MRNPALPPLVTGDPQGFGTAEPRPVIDQAFLSIMEAARQESIELGQRRLIRLATVLSRRVETNFLPVYLSFGRRKLEELTAYNSFAWRKIRSLFGGEPEETTTPILLESFNRDFSDLVLTPSSTKEALRAIGREVARHYAATVASGLQKIQESRGIQFPQWQRYLDNIPPGQVQIAGRPPLNLPISTLAAPDPMRERLGLAIGTALEETFDNFPAVTADQENLRMPNGRSIFDIGSNVWTYYGSYVLYWMALVALLRSGLIPVNL
ncbi:hypothetical protein TI04_04260, partial [Achromatium sp. WMS2]